MTVVSLERVQLVASAGVSITEGILDIKSGPIFRKVIVRCLESASLFLHSLETPEERRSKQHGHGSAHG